MSEVWIAAIRIGTEVLAISTAWVLFYVWSTGIKRANLATIHSELTELRNEDIAKLRDDVAVLSRELQLSEKMATALTLVSRQLDAVSNGRDLPATTERGT